MDGRPGRAGQRQRSHDRDEREDGGNHDDARERHQLRSVFTRAPFDRRPSLGDERGEGERRDDGVLHGETEIRERREDAPRERIQRRVAAGRGDNGRDADQGPEPRGPRTRDEPRRRDHHRERTDVEREVERLTAAVERAHPRKTDEERVVVIPEQVRRHRLVEHQRVQRPEVRRLERRAMRAHAGEHEGHQLDGCQQHARDERARNDSHGRRPPGRDVRDGDGEAGGERHRFSRQRLQRHEDRERDAPPPRGTIEDAIGRPQDPREKRDAPGQVREIQRGHHRPAEREDDRTERAPRGAVRAPQETERPERRDGERQRHPQVERDDVRRQEPDRQRDGHQQLVQRVRDRRLPRAHVGIPERQLPAEDDMTKPDMTRSEEQRQIADVEDAAQREDARDGHDRQRGDERRPCPRPAPLARHEAGCSSAAGARTAATRARRRSTAHHSTSASAAAPLTAAAAATAAGR